MWEGWSTAWEDDRQDLLDRLRDDLELAPWPQEEAAPAVQAEAA